MFVGRNLHEALSHFISLPSENIDRRWPPHNGTELIQAAESGHNDHVIYLLDHGADIHSQDDFGATALHRAAENGHHDVVRTLLLYGASCTLVDNAGRSPLACCTDRKWGQHEDVFYLLQQAIHQPHLLQSHTKSQRHVPIGHHEPPVYDFWVDSICINQDDVLERNAQVALMGRIYTSARAVLVWLGPADEDTKRVLMVLATDERLRSKEDVADPAVLYESRTEAWKLLGRRSWFRRKWVVQEYCLAQQDEVYCGTLQIEPIPPDNDVIFNEQSKPIYEVASLRLWYTHKLREFHHRSSGTWDDATFPPVPPLPSLPALLVQTWNASSTDPRDAIFALLGLAAMAPPQTQDGTRSELIVADYTVSTTDVFIEAGRLFMEARVETNSYLTGSGRLEPLEGLSFVQHQAHDDFTLGGALQPRLQQAPRHIPGVPSWVPHFHQVLPAERFYRYEYCACGTGAGRTATIWPSEATVLRLSAHLLDTVAEIESKGLSQEPITKPFKPNITAWLEMISRLDDVYPIPSPGSTTNSRLEVLWRTLIANDQEIVEWVDSGAKHPFKGFLSQFLWEEGRGREDSVAVLEHLKILSTAGDASLVPSMQEVEDGRIARRKVTAVHLDSFWGKLYVYYMNRSLLRTDHGCLGLGPSRARPGDQIYLVAGARVPFILRPVARSPGDGARARFQFLGECYIHGIMHGEAVEGRSVTFEPIDIQ